MSASANPPTPKLADLYDPFDMSDPFPFYQRARAEEPIFWNEKLGYWVVTRHEDIKNVFKDLETFSSANTGSSLQPHSPAVRKILDDGGMTIESGMSGRMPPSHTRIRSFINKAFTPRRIKSLEEPIRQRVRELLADFQGGRADLVKQLTYDLPALVVFILLGVPDEDVAQVKQWALARMAFQWGNPSEEEKILLAHDMVKYWQYCLALVDKRFEELRDDLPSDLVRIYQAGDQTITRTEMASVCYTMLFAGHETTSNVLAEGIKTLLTQRDQWDLLCNDPALIPNAVEEMLRYGPSIFAWRRITTRPVTLGGVDLPEKAPLLIVLGSANRDEKTFQNGEKFDIMRSDFKEMLTFGHGVKYCLGAPLARLEGQIVLQELISHFPSLRLQANQVIPYRPNSSMRGPAQVWVEWDEPPAYTLSFAAAACIQLARVGGKCASLATMTQAGVPVPPGFAITVEAYSQMLAHSGLRTQIEQALQSVVFGDVHSEDAASHTIRSLIETSPLPPAVESSIRRAYQALCDSVGITALPVAVRSSATAEDLPTASFAGQQDTYLWVVGADAVVEHVRRCWASLYTARAIAYRHDRGFAHEKVLMAVAVQKMVNARAAGVAMTLNPSNGDRSKIAIESSWGLGEAVVAGEVTPDSFLVDKVVFEIVQSQINHKHLEIVPDVVNRCTIHRPIEGYRQSEPSLTHDEVIALARLARQLEKQYGSPQDIEWALDADLPAPTNIMLLQSRPETVWSQKATPTLSTKNQLTGMAGILGTILTPVKVKGS